MLIKKLFFNLAIFFLIPTIGVSEQTILNIRPKTISKPIEEQDLKLFNRLYITIGNI